MPNLIITNACNLSCPFCFASEYLADGDGVPAERMSVEELQRQLEFIGDGAARFCGGEPTTHPQFIRMLDIALEKRGRQVFVMTNAVWPEPVRRHIGALPTGDVVRIRYLVNLLEPALYTHAQWQQLLAVLSTVNPLAVTLGMTLYKVPMEHTHLLEVAESFGIGRVRFSVASPNTTDPRSWNVDPERDFPSLATAVHRLVMDARARKLVVHSDCGYIPPCFFTAEQINDLRKADGHPPAMQFSCEGPVDIGPGGEAWRCYGLFNVVRGKTAEFADAGEIAEDFERQTRQLHHRFMFDACADCDWRRRGECAGGCYAYRVARSTRLRGESQLVRIGEDRRLMDAVPRIHDENVRVLRSPGQGRFMVMVEGSWAPLHLTPIEERVLTACDGERTLATIVDELEVSRVLRQAAPAVTRAIRKLFEQGAVTLSPRAIGDDATETPGRAHS